MDQTAPLKPGTKLFDLKGRDVVTVAPMPRKRADRERRLATERKGWVVVTFAHGGTLCAHKESLCPWPLPVVIRA